MYGEQFRPMRGLRDGVRGLPDPVAADLLVNDDAYLLVVDLPGATDTGTRISTTDGTLSVEAERNLPAVDGDVIRRERPEELSFELPLPEDVDTEAARASLANGVLEVTIPREEPGVTIPIEES